MMFHRCVSEWGTIPFGKGAKELPEPEAERLFSYLERTPSVPMAFHWSRKGLKAAGYVGIVSSGECSVEILPKIEREGETRCRKRLIEMLAVAFDLPIDIGGNASVKMQQTTWLECLIGLFGRELQKALQGGMPRVYTAREDELPILRGRLDVVRQFTRRPCSFEKLYCQYDELCEDAPLNRVMKAALEYLARLTRNAANKRLLSELLSFYPNVASVPKSNLTFDIPLDRSSRRWRTLLGWARFLLENSFQTTRHGRHDGFALLFEMNMLFERYIAKLLSQALTPEGFRVCAQGGFKTCLHLPRNPDDPGVCSTKPDIRILRGSKVLAIIDTKWKKLDSASPHKAYGLSNADAYQMMAYGHLYDCGQLILLYPCNTGETEASADVLAHYGIRDMEGRHLFLAQIDISRSRDECRKALLKLVGPRLVDVGVSA